MPIACLVCAEEEFECENGLYFCKACSTQSQQYVEEEMEEEMGARAGFKPTHAKVKKKDKSSEMKEDIRPWVTSEGFTILLREQIKALIKLGASPALKDVVLRLWTFYLKQIGLGFGDGTDESKHYGSFSRCNFVPTFDKPRPVIVAKELTFSKSKVEDLDSVEEQQALRSAVGGEVFYEEDNPLTAPPKELTELDMYMEHEEEQRSTNKRKRRYEGFRMTLPNSLAFCYIGLQYTNNLVILYDVIKAVKLGHMPYNEGPRIFPADMKFTGHDWRTFCVSEIPGLQYLRDQTSKICKILEVIPLPRPDISQLTLRFVLAMNLPGNLHSLIRTLLRREEPNYGGYVGKGVPCYGAVAMAYVIVAVKLVFGIDDDKESKLACFTEEVIQLLGLESGSKLFNWSDWIKDQESRMSHSHILLDDWRHVRTSTDTDQYCKDFSAHLETRSGSSHINSNINNSTWTTFTKLVEFCDLLCFISGNFIHMELDSCEERNRENVAKIFRQMCAQFDNLSVVQSDEERKSKDCAASHVTENKAEGSDSEKIQNLENKYGYIDYTQHSIQHIFDWENFISQFTEHNNQASDSLTETLERLSEKRIKAWENYVFYTNKADLTHCHTSYNYLLELAVNHIGCNQSLLHYFVQNIEVFYLGQGRTGHHKTTFCTFKGYYFCKKHLC